MNKKHKKRLEQLTDILAKEQPMVSGAVEAFYPYDLVLLLQHHPQIRALVAEIAASAVITVPSEALPLVAPVASNLVVLSELEQIQQRLQEAETDKQRAQEELRQLREQWEALEPEHERYRCDLEWAQSELQKVQQRNSELVVQTQNAVVLPEAVMQLVKLLQAQPSLAHAWLKELPTAEGELAVKVIAAVAVWRGIEALWDCLAHISKQQKLPVIQQQQQLLDAALALHQTLTGDTASALVSAELDARYDAAQYERCCGRSGQTIAQQCLPGLRNSDGKLVRKSLVKTA
ncbi:hypothetical protein [Aquaspirillum serpens]|uniref:hypothetical protein n=1 Tax=Aquaspirillum serpens TaxID=190 RepID=UPI0003B4B50D|nr:hypothetical protein [Aquaspirillum serpens]